MGKGKDTALKAAHQDRKATHRATRKQDGALVRVAGKASEVADQPPLIALSAATILLGAVLRRPAVARSGVRMLASHLLATGVKTILKNAVDRTRPARAVKTGYRVGKGTGADDPSLNSFPSGHTAGAVAVAQAVASENRLVALPLQTAAIGVAALQPSRGKHYLTDVIAGAAIGWAAERVARAAIRAGEAGLEAGRARLMRRDA